VEAATESNAAVVNEPLLVRAERERPRLVAIARRVLGDGALGEDVAQEVYVRLAKLPEEPRSLPAWLRAVCYRVAIDVLRRRQRAEQTGAEMERASMEPTPSEAAEERERAQRALSALAGLDDPYREALQQRFCEGQSFREIAERMGAPERTVRTWVGRGLMRLRQRLGEVS